MTDVGWVKGKAEQHLGRKWTNTHDCPICGTNGWNPCENAAFLEQEGGFGVMFPARRYPVFPVICMQCGYTFLINGMVAGLVDKGGK